MTDIVIQTTPNIAPHEVPGYTDRIVTLFYAYALGTARASDPAIRGAQQESRERGITPEAGRLRANLFIELLVRLCEGDETLSVLEKKHIQRMLEQTQRFLHSIALVLQGTAENRARSNIAS